MPAFLVQFESKVLFSKKRKKIKYHKMRSKVGSSFLLRVSNLHDRRNFPFFRMQNKNDRNQRREENVSQENTNFDDRPPTSHNSDVEQSTNGDGSSDRRSCDHFVGDCCSTLPWNTSDRSPPTTPKNEPPTAVCGGQATSSTAFPEVFYI